MTGVKRGELCGLQWADVDLESVRSRLLAPSWTTPISRSRRRRPNDRAGMIAYFIPTTTARKLQARRLRYARSELWPAATAWDSRRTCSPTTWTDGGHCAPSSSRSGGGALPTLQVCNAASTDLRHFTATQLLGAGVAVTTVSERLGHASTKMTVDVYGHPVRGADRKAAELLGELMTSSAAPTS